MLMLAGAWLACGQTATTRVVQEEEIRGMLASTEASQLAWGAYLAGDAGDRKFVASVIPLLRNEDPDVQLAAVDALIRIGVELPPETLQNLRIDGGLDPVLVLLSRNPIRYSGLLTSLLDQGLDTTEWVAVNSIRWKLRSPTWVSRLLRDWTIQIKVEVWDQPGYIDGCCSWTMVSQKAPRNRTGFPPIWRYVIYERTLMPGATTLIPDGPHPISFVRQHEPRQGGPLVNLNEHRRDYLQELASFSLPRSGVRFNWIDEAKYKSDTNELMALIRRCQTSLRQILRERGLLDARELTESPQPEIRVEDQRIDKRVPLPSIEWRP